MMTSLQVDDVHPQRPRAFSDVGVYGRRRSNHRVSIASSSDSKASDRDLRPVELLATQAFSLMMPCPLDSGITKIPPRECDPKDEVDSSDSSSQSGSWPRSMKSASSTPNVVHGTLLRHGSDQFLHVPSDKDMRNKEIKNAKLISQRNLSVSTPVMPPSRSLIPSGDDGLIPHSSKSRNKKFHRIFKQVPPEEKVLNYFACALIADILLQGHLYISENYFGFYSNVFGHITKILIPVNSVIKITKEKTAKIIPNAVGIYTEDDKHVFGSLLSRESAFRLMHKVWNKTLGPLDLADEEEDSGSAIETKFGRQTSTDSAMPEMNTTSLLERSCPSSLDSISLSSRGKSSTTSPVVEHAPPLLFNNMKEHQPQVLRTCFQKVYGITPLQKMHCGLRSLMLHIFSLPRPTLLLLLSTILLVFLFLSAAVLIYRLNVLQQRMGSFHTWNSNEEGHKPHLFEEVIKWQQRFRDTSTIQMQEALDIHLDQLAQVRKSLQTLMLLIVPENRKQDATTDNS